MTLIVNLFGGPSTGKSTMAAAIFTELKCQHITCELVQEYAKDKVWEQSFSVLENQIYVFGKQLHRMYRIFDKVDVIVTDSPLLMSIHYGTKESYIFKALVLEQHNKTNSLNIFLKREHRYDPIGRIQTEKEAQEMDKQMLDMLVSNSINYVVYSSDKSNIPKIISLIKDRINHDN